MYQARVLELKQLILAEEARFKFVIAVEALFPLLAYCLISSSVAAEIEAIRAGKWDTKIEEDLGVDESNSDGLALSPKSEVCFLCCHFLSEAQLLGFAASQRDRRVWFRSHGCVRHELIRPAGAGSYARVLCWSITAYPN